MVAFSIRPAVLLFGDSITQFSFGEGAVQFGWGSLLASAYQRRADVLNRGFSGYNTQHALELVPRVFAPAENGLLFCTVFFGANDASIAGEPQHVPLEEYEANLVKIITAIRESIKKSDDESCENAFPIIMVTPPPVDAEAWKESLGLYDYYDRTNEITRKYGEVAKKVAKQLDCATLDTWELLGGDTNDYGKHLSDGLHLNESGERLVFEGLMNLIKTDYPHLAPQEYTDGEYRGPGIPVEEKLWNDLC
jgi:lysophospholipase L1-like esterase